MTGTVIRQDAQQADPVLGKAGDHAVVQQVRSRDGRLLCVEFANGHAGVGIDKSLLVDAPDALHCANIVGVLAAEMTRMVALDLGMRLFLLPGLLQRG